MLLDGLIAQEDIPPGHKIARHEIPWGT